MAQQRQGAGGHDRSSPATGPRRCRPGRAPRQTGHSAATVQRSRSRLPRAVQKQRVTAAGRKAHRRHTGLRTPSQHRPRPAPAAHSSACHLVSLDVAPNLRRPIGRGQGQSQGRHERAESEGPGRSRFSPGTHRRAQGRRRRARRASSRRASVPSVPRFQLRPSVNPQWASLGRRAPCPLVRRPALRSDLETSPAARGVPLAPMFARPRREVRRLPLVALLTHVRCEAPAKPSRRL